jgi:hypothetical protein
MSIKFTPSLGTHHTTVGEVKPADKPVNRRSDRLKGARLDAGNIKEGLVDYGPQTGLMVSLSSAINGTGKPWQELRQEVLSHLPGDPGLLQLSFKKAFEQAEASAESPGNAYTSALRQLQTAFSMARIFRGI